MSCILAEFDSDQRLLDGAAHMHGLGYDAMETYTPFPIPDLDRFLRARPPRIAFAVLIAGVAGAVGSYLIEWGTTIDYPLRVADFALDSLPAFIPIVFESTVLAGALTAFIAVFYRSELCRWWHPLDEIDGFERAVIDRFFLAIHLNPSNHDADLRCRDELSSCRPLRIITVAEAR